MHVVDPGIEHGNNSTLAGDPKFFPDPHRADHLKVPGDFLVLDRKGLALLRLQNRTDIARPRRVRFTLTDVNVSDGIESSGFSNLLRLKRY